MFRDRLRKLRNEKVWSQDKLAQKLGISNSVVGRYETGDTYPSTERLIEIAKIFNVSLDYLAGLSETRGELNEEELKKDPDLLRIVNQTRPYIGDRPATDEEWKLIVSVLESFSRNDNSNVS